ncbi:helix-turn-helix domain-containing protein [Nocardiopsis chromatogenes]|uniref:helix-turn-helix domain-containing protein n=1 Tax=Nocardiopsis chromatogenes TaxID=280239 RepID=UPI000A02D7A1|nr:helix-turn-helix transcriptional regulator [Nocardiopsis chromatogenes]
MVERIHEEWRQWGNELKRMRLQAGETMDSLARKARVSRQIIGKYEAATRVPQRDKAAAMDEALATGDALTLLWEQIMDDAHVPPEFRNALMMERRSKHIREYHAILVPGLLQTPDYAITLVRARRVNGPPESIDQVVQTRVERLQKLSDMRPLLWFVVEWVALTRVVGDEKIMREQRRHLIDLMEGGTIQLQVIEDSRHNPGLCGAYRVMSLHDGRTVGFVEDPLGGRSVTKREEIDYLSTLFGMLQSEALSPRSTLERLKELDHA